MTRGYGGAEVIMANGHLALGEAGEEMAARFLENRGLRIVGRRVRFRRGELDIVARDGREWVFVEVKTRRHDRMGSAAEAMTPRKAGRMQRAIEEYVRLHGLHGEPMRRDFVAIDFFDGETPTIQHYPGGIDMM